MSGPADEAVALFRSGCNCAQAICAAFGPGLGLAREPALALASGLGAGIARQGEACGAVVGAALVLGLRHGRTPDAPEGKRVVYPRVNEFLDRFRERHGSIRCRDLIGRDLRTDEAIAEARRDGLFASVCEALVRDAAELLARAEVG